MVKHDNILIIMLYKSKHKMIQNVQKVVDNEDK